MILSLEIGATNTRIALVKENKVFNKKLIKTPKTKSAIIHSIFSLISQYKEYQCICVAVAGIVDKEVIVKTSNMNFSNVNLKKILENTYKVSVYLDNDAKCAALAEQKYGIGKKENNFFLVSLGTGIGGAQVLTNKVKSIEIGHILIDGKEFEDLASGTAALKLAKSLGFSKETNEEIYTLAKKNNSKALNLYKELGNNLASGLILVSKRYNPKTFVFSGGFSKINYYIKAAQAAFRARYPKKVEFRTTKLGDNIGLIGAALLYQ